MTRSTARRLAPIAVVALALLAGGCSSDDSTDTERLARSQCRGVRVRRPSAAASPASRPMPPTSRPPRSTRARRADEVQQQVDDLQGKADKVRDDLNTMMMESQGGPAAAVIGALNQKADALRAQLTIAKTDAQADLGPKITAAQEEITAAIEPVTAAVSKLCPSS